VNTYCDAEPAPNLRIFANFNGESSEFTDYFAGGNSHTSRALTPGCTAYNDLPVPCASNSAVNFEFYHGISHNEHVPIGSRFSSS
jgi:hypothetical protein